MNVVHVNIRKGYMNLLKRYLEEEIKFSNMNIIQSLLIRCCNLIKE